MFHRILSRILTSALWRKDSGIVLWPAKMRHAFPFWTRSHFDSFEMEMLAYQETGTGQRVTHTLYFSSYATPKQIDSYCPCCSRPSAEGATLVFWLVWATTAHLAIRATENRGDQRGTGGCWPFFIFPGAEVVSSWWHSGTPVFCLIWNLEGQVFSLIFFFFFFWVIPVTKNKSKGLSTKVL